MRSMGAALSRQQSECARGETDPHMALHAVTYGGVKHQSFTITRVGKRIEDYHIEDKTVDVCGDDDDDGKDDDEQFVGGAICFPPSVC